MQCSIIRDEIERTRLPLLRWPPSTFSHKASRSAIAQRCFTWHRSKRAGWQVGGRESSQARLSLLIASITKMLALRQNDTGMLSRTLRIHAHQSRRMWCLTSPTMELRLRLAWPAQASVRGAPAPSAWLPLVPSHRPQTRSHKFESFWAAKLESQIQKEHSPCLGGGRAGAALGRKPAPASKTLSAA